VRTIDSETGVGRNARQLMRLSIAVLTFMRVLLVGAILAEARIPGR
jgi:hypothetical protein